MSEILSDDALHSGISFRTVGSSVPETVAALLADDEQLCDKCGKAVKKAALKCRFCDCILDPALRQQEVLKSAESARVGRMRAYLRQSGIGWLIVAAIQFVFSGSLSATWGLVCVVLGVLNLSFPVRAVLAFNGVGMMFIGVVNAAGSLSAGSPGFMTYLGGMQVIWGFKELGKFATGEVQDKRK